MTAIPTTWHPLPMTDMLVRATEAGLKTETRRLVSQVRGIGPVTHFGSTETPGYDWKFRDREARWHDLRHAELLERCPYGQVGDGFWIRQAWTARFGDELKYWHDVPKEQRTDKNCRELILRSRGDNTSMDVRWVPPMFMPTWACANFAHLVALRIESLQDITDDAIRAEGVAALTLQDLLRMASQKAILQQVALVLPNNMPRGWKWDNLVRMWPEAFVSQERWRVVWGLINGHRPGCRWEDNPSVWVLQYERLSTDEVLASLQWRRFMGEKNVI